MPDRGHGGESFLNRKHAIADTGIDRIQRHKRITGGFILEVQRLDEQDFLTLMAGIFLRGDDLSDDSGENHAGRCTSSTMATMVASVGTSVSLNANEAS